MAMMVNKDIKQDYINAVNNTCDDIKKQSDKIFDDMFDKQIEGIEIKIIIEPNTIVRYEVTKTYLTEGEK